ncbi:MAG: hypothetical protein GY788_00930 [bacterium]|nr:hypothetical protein [bacterium]
MNGSGLVAEAGRSANRNDPLTRNDRLGVQAQLKIGEMATVEVPETLGQIGGGANRRLGQ